MTRRQFLHLTATAFAAAHLPNPVLAAKPKDGFEISLAEWSLNKSIRAKKLDNLDFPKVARDLNIPAIEFVDQFFADKAKDMAYLKELKQRAKDHGIRCHLIMLDTNGALGAKTKAARDQSVEKTLPWIDAAKFLGCSTIRVNAYGEGTPEELRDQVAESMSRLADYAAPRQINVTIENHGRLSSNPDWLVSVMKAVNKPNFGTLPDFGNFPPEINRYDAVEALMPYAHAVSAKASKFTPDGLVEETDFFRMMRIVRDAGFHGYHGIECESPKSADFELEAIKITRDLLIRIRHEHAKVQPIFNGKNLSGWEKIEGGDWKVDNGVLIGRNGKTWSTNPEKTGSWLSTRKKYKDFRLEFQYAINKGGNSGVFFRSRHDKNPAFTGYEMQIVAAPGKPATKTGASSLYDTMAPTKNLVRAADQWNFVTIIAKGPRIQIEMNGEPVMDTQLDRSLEGYLGLQNHDDKSEVRFKNIRLQEL